MLSRRGCRAWTRPRRAPPKTSICSFAPTMTLPGRCCRWLTRTHSSDICHCATAGFLFAAVILLASAYGAGAPAFRTDGGYEKLPWFQLKTGEFPREGSPHCIGGELTP